MSARCGADWLLPRDLSDVDLDRRIIGRKIFDTVAYLDRTGSGNETAAHLKADGRLTIMFCAFDGPPNILRLYGRGEVLRRGGSAYASAAARPPLAASSQPARARSFASTSTWCRPPAATERRCSIIAASAPRSTIGRVAKGEDGLEAYRREKNMVSIDGLPTGWLDEAQRLEGAIVVFGWRSHRRNGYACRSARPIKCARLNTDSPMLDIPNAPPAGADYATVKRAIEFISKRYRDQPSVEAIAEPCRPFGFALPACLQALGGLDAEGVSAGDHHRAGARTPARFGERARRGL